MAVIAIPISLQSMITIGVNMTDTVMVGKLGETSLSATALANQFVNIYQVGLYRSLLPHYLASKTVMGNTTIAKMSKLINLGQLDEALLLFKTFLETVPYCDNTNYEGHYQQMMYIMFALLTNFRILVEQHTAKGRTDITMETHDTIYIMELKFNKTAEEALQQINDKQYADAFALQNKPVVKVGINYTIKEKISTLEWVIE